MNREDIIAMAREAGLSVGEDFAAGRVCEIERFFQAAQANGAAAEREACAKVCEVNHHTVKRNLDSFECAATIRARSSNVS